MQTERFGGDIRTKYSRGSCAFSDRDSPEVFRVLDNGIFKRKVIDTSISSLRKNRKTQYWGRHFWSRGYCVSTVGLDEEQIRMYVKWQEKKEKDNEKDQLN